VIFIINGALVEKVKYLAYPFIALAVAAFTWPVVVAWIQSGGGWMDRKVKDHTVLD